MSEESHAVKEWKNFMEALAIVPSPTPAMIKVREFGNAVLDELIGEKEHNASLTDQKQHLIERVNDCAELIRHAVEHDDPKRVLREFIEARPELFGERKDT